MYEKINNEIEKILLDKDVSNFNGYYYLLDNLYKVHVSKDARILGHGLNKIDKIYNFLIEEYRRIIKGNLLEKSTDKLRKVYNLNENFTYTKLVDSLIWKYTIY